MQKFAVGKILFIIIYFTFAHKENKKNIWSKIQ